ncbi:hypothetical protein QBC43DRAFT_313857 [Cladorrhinum sp. PSN259]|nr:hypothetical protein QBC43DRAFT_313857 [Cladorrhinum sp. PSN259]
MHVWMNWGLQSAAADLMNGFVLLIMAELLSVSLMRGANRHSRLTFYHPPPTTVISSLKHRTLVLCLSCVFI